jgi:hypothetical protein
MCETDRFFLERLREHAGRTRTFLSNPMKSEREPSVCRALLRTLGVAFDDSELIAPTIEPADVAFRDARFQVRDLLRERKRGDNWKERENQYLEARSLDELVTPYSPPSPIDLASLIPEVAAALAEKTKKYGVGCKGIDALIYADLEGAFLNPNSSVTNTNALERQGWRSVSLLFSPHGVVLFATTNAPIFLLGAVGKTCTRCTNIDSLFEP